MHEILAADLHRYGITKVTWLRICNYTLFSSTPGVRFILVHRLLQYYKLKTKFMATPFYLLNKHLKVKYGYDISFRTQIGPGFYLGHFGGVVIHGDSIIGKNCNISQNVTIGVSNHGPGKGTPILGDNVFVGPGAVIIGSIRIGNNVTVGANTVVNFDVPDFSTVITSGSVIVPKDLSPFYIHNPIK